MVYLKVLYVMYFFYKKILFLILLNFFCCYLNIFFLMFCMFFCIFCIFRLDLFCFSLFCGIMFDEEILFNLILEWKNIFIYKKNIIVNILVIMIFR